MIRVAAPHFDCALLILFAWSIFLLFASELVLALVAHSHVCLLGLRGHGAARLRGLRCFAGSGSVDSPLLGTGKAGGLIGLRAELCGKSLPERRDRVAWLRVLTGMGHRWAYPLCSLAGCQAAPHASPSSFHNFSKVATIGSWRHSSSGSQPTYRSSTSLCAC